MNNKIIGAAVISLLVGFGAGYFVHSVPTQPQNARGNFAGGTTRGSGGQGGLLSGTVAKQDAGSITLNTRDGSSHVVLITPATTVQKSVSGVLSDVTVGSTIFVTGSTNSDGSVSASSIQLRPAAPPATVQ